MVRAHYSRKDFRRLHTREEFRSDEKVVYTPSNIPCSHSGHVAPPCVGAYTLGMEVTKNVDETGRNESVEPFALGKEEASCVFVGFWIRKVDLSMCGVEVACDNDWFNFFKFGELGQYVMTKLEFEGDPCVVSLTIGEIAVQKEKVGEFVDEYTTFGVETVLSKFFCVKNFFPGKCRDPRVSFFFSRTMSNLVAWEFSDFKWKL